MYSRLLLGIVLLVLGTVAAEAARAQRHRLVPVGDWTYAYIERLQRRGYLLELPPTALPYTQGDVAEALRRLDRTALGDVEARWVRLLERALALEDADGDAARLGVLLEAGLDAANTDRLDVLRPTGGGSPALAAGDVRLYPNAALRAYVESGRVIAHLGLQHSVYYNDDPDGLDVANRLMVRSEPAYVGYDGRLVRLYAGRFGNHWGVPGEGATVVSGNPRPYDQLHVRLGGARLAVRALLGELDSITEDGRFTGRVGDDTVRVGSKRRFLAAHRFDWRPSHHLSLSVVEAVLYSGANAGGSLKYLNPLHALAFVEDNTPKNEENNGFVAGMLWAQVRPFTLHGQLLIDDVDVLGQGSEPASLALVGALHWAGALPQVDLGLRFEAVTSRTYNTGQAEGRYLYALRGLGLPFSDYVHAALQADVYLDRLLPGLILMPQVRRLLQGERDFRQPFPRGNEGVGLILDGTPERTVRLAAALRYQPSPRWWVAWDYGANFVSDAGFVERARRTRFVGLLAFGARFRLDRPFSLDVR